MPTSDIEAALTRLHAPRPNFDAFAAQARVFAKHFRAFVEASRAANGRNPGMAPADALAKLLGDAEAPLLRHAVCDAYENAGPAGAELRLVHALRAASESPAWDPSLVAWSYNGLAQALVALDRKDDARAVIRASWAYDPFYPTLRETAATLGLAPPATPSFAGSPDSLRLAGLAVLFGDLRSEKRRSIAMAVSLAWSGDNAAAAAMATLADKPTKDTGTWGPDVLAHATRLAKKMPGAAKPLPAGSPTARLKAVEAALKAGDVAALRALALDPYPDVLLEAWAGLALVGEGEQVRGLLEEMIAASTVGRTKTEGCRNLERALAAMPRASRAKATPTAKGSGTPPEAQNEAVALVVRALAKIEAGAEHSLPRDRVKVSKRSLALAPPSLIRWLEAGGLEETTPTSVESLAKRAHGKLFANLPTALAKSLALPLEIPELCNDTLEILLLDPTYADAHGETPVLALDVSDGPAAWLTAPSFGAWLAEDVGAKGGARTPSALRDASARTLGAPDLRL